MAAPARWSKRLASVAAGALLVLAITPASAPSRTTGTVAEQTLTVTIHNEAREGASDPGPPPWWGAVRSTPAGIDCPTQCSAPFSIGTNVELTAVPAAGYSISSWNALPNSEDCNDGPTCSLTIDSGPLTPNVDAFFHPAAGLQAVTAGPGALSLSPVEPGAHDVCRVEVQQEAEESTCIQRFTTGTRVTLTAHPDAGAGFAGWSDYRCLRKALSCTLTLAAGEHYITARFSPVKLTIQGTAFGRIVATPGGTCTPTEAVPSCSFTYPTGTTVTLRRQHGATGKFWIGGCDGNTAGTLDLAVCRLHLHGDELVGAGLESADSIPPARRAGLDVTRDGTGRGTVTGVVLTEDDAPPLSCGAVCSISGLSRYDHMRLIASASRGSHFLWWSDGITLRVRTIQLANVSRIKATFARN